MYIHLVVYMLYVYMYTYNIDTYDILLFTFALCCPRCFILGSLCYIMGNTVEFMKTVALLHLKQQEPNLV